MKTNGADADFPVTMSFAWTSRIILSRLSGGYIPNRQRFPRRSDER